jgi:demethylsterigmatocystin 6-O-methyltransferase
MRQWDVSCFWYEPFSSSDELNECGISTDADGIYQNLQLSVVRVGCDLRIFDLIAAHKVPMTLEELQRATGADVVLLGRLLRYLSSVGMIREAEQGTFAATNVTSSLADPGNQAGIRHYFDHVGPQFQQLPSFLSRNGYQNISDRSRTVFHTAWNTELPVFEWLSQHPEHFDNLNQHMAARRLKMSTWLSVFLLEQEAKDWHEGDPLFVDIGGGIGHQCAKLKAIYPNIRGRVILQDLPYSTDRLCLHQVLRMWLMISSYPSLFKVLHLLFLPCTTLLTKI